MTDQLGALTTIFTEFYYWVTVVLMFLIHVGFCMYEVGASRYKHHQHTLMKNTMLIPLVTVTWFFFGWWIYWAFPTGPGIAPSIMNESTALITDESTFSAKWYDRANPRFKRSTWTFRQYPGSKVAVFHGKPDPLQLADPHPYESYDKDTIAWVKKHWK